MVRHATVITYGCQMNEYDSGRFRRMLVDAGYALTDDLARCEVIVVNTCAVRGTAEERAVGRLTELGGLRAAQPGLVLAVAGCVAKERGSDLLQYANAVVYPDAVDDFAAALPTLTARSRVVLDGRAGQAFARTPVAQGLLHFITVMTGCTNGCAYCIVPAVRGPERSRPADAVVAEARAAVAAGARELTLLGQNVNAYGRERAGEIGFPELLRRVAAVPGLLRLRFVTSHPRDFGDGLVAAMAATPGVMPALHLPAQSGSDRILAAMGRGYTAAHYRALAGKLRAALPDLALSSDFIVGYPGETDADFAETLALVRQVGFAHGFVFKYSPRPGTRAAALPERVSDDVVAARHRELLTLIDAQAVAVAQAQVGREVEVLVESVAGGVARGRTRENRGTALTGGGVPGVLLRARVTGTRGRVLLGEVRE